MHPRRSPTVHTETLGDEVAVYDRARQQVHALNATAGRVWQLCDGATSPEAMAAALRRDLALPEAEAVVTLTLRHLARAHLLEVQGDLPADRRGLTRRALLGRGVAASLLPAIYSIVAPPPVAAQSPPPTGSMPFAFSGDVQTFTVPAGVTTLTVIAQGAQGGSAVQGVVPGGQGGSVTATLTVVPGETLNVLVGGQGETGAVGATAAGGFNDGGGGGGSIAGGGGGASDIRRGEVALLVAGGGGGAGISTADGGGPGGSPTGGAGADSLFQPTITGGEGGTQGDGGEGGVNQSNSAFNGDAGADGTGGAGGPGAPGVPGMVAAGPAGGGGGGGYHGGGGGAGGASVGTGSGSGGGGSSFAESGGDRGRAHARHPRWRRRGHHQLVGSAMNQSTAKASRGR